MKGLVCHRPAIVHPHFPQSRRSAVVARAAHNNDKSLFVFGLGYTGLAAAHYFTQRKWHVSGTCRSDEKAEELCSRGFDAYKYDADGYEQLSRFGLAALHKATHVLSTVPPDGDTDPVLMAHSKDLIGRGDRLKWVGYISSTSVYGDHGSDWVDEESELLAAHGKGLSRILSEGAWISLCFEYDVPVHVFRCGGIYGPRRSALDAVLREGPPSSGQERRAKQKFTARCHVADICRVLEASGARPRAGAVYNVVDDDTAGRGEVIEFAERLLAGRMAANFHEMPLLKERNGSSSSRSDGVGGGGGGRRRVGLDSMESVDDFSSGIELREGSSSSSSSSSEDESFGAGKRGGGREGEATVVHVQSRVKDRKRSNNSNDGRSSGKGEKQVRNELIKKELGVTLEFPTYREGLRAIFNGDSRPFE